MNLGIWHSMVLYPNIKENEQMQCPNDKHNFIQIVAVKNIIGMKSEPVCEEALCDNQETG